MNPVLHALTQRRTHYALNNSLPLPDAEVEQLIREAIRQAPSSFNSQSSRALILFGDASRALWELTRETLRPLVPAEQFASTDAKMDGFAAAAGTVLFFEDLDTIRQLQEQFPLYADNFPIFSEHSAGMAQLAVWTTLAAAGIGASLQHYNPLIDAEVARRWDLPASWSLRAQMPFGSPTGTPGEKSFMDDAQRFRVVR